MRRNVNFVLLYLVVFLLLSLVGMTVYYQGTYSSLKSEYDTTYGSLSKRVESLEQENANLSARILELNTSAVRSAELGERYAEVKSEKEKCEVALFGTKETLASVQKQNYVLSEQMGDVKSLRSELKNAVDSLDSHVRATPLNFTLVRSDADELKRISSEFAAIK